MNNVQIALISDTPDVSFGELSQVSAAIQKQLSRDFGPIWNVSATVDCFDGLASVPSGYCIVHVTSDLGPNDGIHRTEDGTPMAFPSKAVLPLLSHPWAVRAELIFLSKYVIRVRQPLLLIR